MKEIKPGQVKRWQGYLLDVGLNESKEGSMYSDTDDGQMEVVEQDRDVVVQPFTGAHVQSQRALADALQLVLALWAETTNETNLNMATIRDCG